MKVCLLIDVKVCLLIDVKVCLLIDVMLCLLFCFLGVTDYLFNLFSLT